MTDRIFAPALAFFVLIGAALAIGSAWFDSRTTVHTVRLPAVEIIGKRVAQPLNVAMLERGATGAAAARGVQ